MSEIPVAYCALAFIVLYEPPVSSTSPPRGVVASGTDWKFMEPAYDAVPKVLDPTPRWTCTLWMLLRKSGTFEKYST